MFFKKKERFSIRKFTIGACSVLVGTAFVASIDNVQAEQIESANATEVVSDITPKTETIENKAVVGATDAVENKLTSEATETPVGTKLDSEKAVLESQPDAESTKVEEKAPAEKVEDSKASAKEEEDVTVKETGEFTIAPKRDIVAVYKVNYVDEATSEVVYESNRSVVEKTSLPKSERATVNLAVESEIGQNPALAGWKLARNQASVVELAVVERGGRRNTAIFRVVKDQTSGSDNSYTGFRTTEDAGSTSSLLPNKDAIQADNASKIQDDYSVTNPNTEADTSKKAPKFVDPKPGRFTYAVIGYGNNKDFKYILSVDSEAPADGGIKAPRVYVTPIDASGKPLADSYVAELSNPGDAIPFTNIDPANPTITVSDNGQVVIKPHRNGVINANKIGTEENLVSPPAASINYLDEVVLPSPSYDEQITKYVEYKTNKPLLDDYKQAGWTGYAYTTEPFDIPGYKLVSINTNQDGTVSATPNIGKGDITYTRLVAPLGRGSMTIYRKMEFDTNDGHGTMTIYVSPKNANKPDEAATLPSAEEFFKNIENYTTYERKVYMPETDITTKTVYSEGVRQEAERRYQADSSKTIQEYKDEIIAAERGTIYETDKDAFYRASFAEKTVSQFRAEGRTGYLEYGVVNSRPLELPIDSVSRAAFYEPVLNSRAGVTGIATIRGGWRPSDSVIYEYAKIEKVEAEYFVEGTDTHLYPDPADYDKENPEKKEVAKDIDGKPYADTDVPPTLTDKDGIVYELVVNEDSKPVLKSGSAPQEGEIAYGGGQVIQYQYAAKKGGEVAAQYYVEGTTTRLYPEDNTDKSDTVVKAQDTPVGTKYEDTPPPTLKDKDGVVYELVTNPDGTPKIKAGSAATTGTVTEEKQTIQYEYAPKVGSQVTVEYVDTEGKPIKEPAEVKPKDTPVGTEYDSNPQRENTIKDPETGKTYKLVTKEGNYPVGDVANDGHLVTSKLGTEGVDDPTGQVGETPKVITYVYEEVKGDVVVLYRVNDGKGTPITGIGSNGVTIGNVSTADTQDKQDDADRTEWVGAVIDTPASSTGSDYTTTDNRPETITTADGKVYKRVEKVAGKEDGDVVEGTTRIVYYYELVKGDVIVHYVDKNGNPITGLGNNGVTIGSVPTSSTEDKEDDKKGPELPGTVIDTASTDTGSSYSTTDNRPETITTPEGKKYRLVPNLTKGQEEGTVTPGTTEVTYVYEEVTGDVVLHYVDTEGNVLQPNHHNTDDKPLSETYTVTKDEKPEKLTRIETGEDGQPKEVTYILKEQSTSATVGKNEVVKDTSDTNTVVTDETGPVKEGTQNIIYVYEKAGSVNVNYVDENGNPITFVENGKEVPGRKPVLENEKAGTAYDTTGTDNRPKTIKTPDGKTYELVPAGNYGAGVVDNQGHLTTTDATDGSVEAGKVKEVTYVYKEVKGDVVVLYRENGTGNPITGVGSNGVTIGNVSTADTQDKEDDTARPEWEGAVIDTPASSTGSDYTTTDNRPETITTADGKVYKRVEKVAGKEDGDVVEGTTRIVYYYELQKGNVDVTYVDTDGNPIAPAKEVAKDADTGTDYDTKTDELKPPTITTADGKTYELVPAGEYGVGDVDKDGHLVTSAPVDGKVKEEDQTITYVYKEVKGDVIVHYVDKDGNPISKDVTDTPETSTGKDYDTKDNRPEEIKTPDGKTYKRVPDLTKGKEEGKVTPGTTEVTYVYEEVKGDVIVHYVDEAGNPIAKDETDTPLTSTGTVYETFDHKPTTITTADGKTYELVPSKTIGAEKGKVVEGTTEITYVYKEVKGDVIVHYVDKDGNPIAKDKVDEKDTPTGEGYDTKDNRPEEIKTPDGKTYKRVPDLTKGEEEGKVTPGTTEVTYVYEEVKGDVVVHYVDEAGNPIAKDETDTPLTSTGTVYETFDHKPITITTADGKTYELVPSKTIGAEKGKVVEGTTEITYVYKEVPPTDNPERYVPYIPKDPKNPVDPNDPHDPTIPETGGKIPEVPYDKTPEDPSDDPRLPEVPDYIPVDPSDPTKPLPKDPNGGYIPPTPVDPKKPTPVPYLPAGTVIVHYVNEEGKVIQNPTIDTPKSLVGTDYNTNENGREIPKEITGKDGLVYELVKVKEGDKEIGKVVKGNTDVTYIYKLKEGDLEVNYVDEAGNPVAPQENSKGKPNDPYTTTPKEIEGYEWVRVEGDDPSGSYINGKKKVTYVYKKKETPTPGKPTPPPVVEEGVKSVVEEGDLEVNYVDEDGNPVAPQENSKGKPNDPYTTTPKEIEGYELVRVEGDDPSGSYINGKKKVTYVYKKKVTPTPGKPIEPGKPATPPMETQTPEQPSKEIYMKSDAQTLPNTGDANGNPEFIYMATALGLAALGMVGKKRKEEE
ncbi:YSIRK-type signal peptide-containing protein [Streptococcus sp. zg-86]|uniref:YSIRK-type signal peptide-containing protein n=1 Tax=Streptococcus zhangguiae TaxID=2664091 RepID=A0ABW9R5J9_9STRE|nr:MULTISPECIES: MucBP domain-containing protein [unclassified Streptococcus]MTB64771.1 YSIRK-type signal peptide-containing protein [Streptococcus sp. zg-86]MTB91343.1 YSIRK-type signal peptide-containing protein [Streptococcus sp. zg-36]QTH48458.1 MucBP domain-containing protein [Streptococcus sp. zg-86]